MSSMFDYVTYVSKDGYFVAPLGDPRLERIFRDRVSPFFSTQDEAERWISRIEDWTKTEMENPAWRFDCVDSIVSVPVAREP